MPAMCIFMLGASASAAVDSGTYPINDFLTGKLKLASNNALPSIGAGIQASFNIGFSLALFKMLPSFGFFDPKKLTFYAQYLSLTLPSTLVTGLSGQATNWGVFAQYRLFNPVGLGMGTLQWGGVLVQAGFISSSQKVLFEVPFSDSQKVSDSWNVDQYTLGYDLTLDWSTKGTLGAQMLSTHIPLEISTSARVFYMFSWYGGLALDLNWGLANHNCGRQRSN